MLPPFVESSAVRSALCVYGNILQVSDEMWPNLQIKTGTRLVDIEMARPVPNFVTIGDHTVPVFYRGVKLQCRRCKLEGHLVAECGTAYCSRCKNYGHLESTCSVNCLKCGDPDHHWRSCTVRSYAFAAGSGAVSAEFTDGIVGSDAADDAAEANAVAAATTQLSGCGTAAASVDAAVCVSETTALSLSQHGSGPSIIAVASSSATVAASATSAAAVVLEKLPSEVIDVDRTMSCTGDDGASVLESTLTDNDDTDRESDTSDFTKVTSRREKKRTHSSPLGNLPSNKKLGEVSSAK